MGCTSPPCGVDSYRRAAHCYDVWFGGDANAVSETTARKRASTSLLRDQRSRLAQELVLYACTLPRLRNSVQWQVHLIATILHQLETAQTVPLQLPHLSDPRLVRIGEIFLRNPCDSRTLAQLCRVSGASKRSIERLFQQEIGMTFGKWRQQLRLMEGMRLLAEGAKVTDAALECGYSTPSAFISMFRKVLGTTPSSYFR
jgi:AraC-like DNA-binding protein